MRVGHEGDPIVHVDDQAGVADCAERVVVPLPAHVQMGEGQEGQPVERRGVHHGRPEHADHLPDVQVLAFAADHVQLRVRAGDFLLDVLVQAAYGEDRQGAERVERQPHPVLEEGRARVARDPRVVHDHEDLNHVPPERKQRVGAGAAVVPPAVNEEELLQILELPDREVRVVHRLAPLAARYPDANLRLLDHGHVVGAVAYRQGHGRGLDALADLVCYSML